MGARTPERSQGHFSSSDYVKIVLIMLAVGVALLVLFVIMARWVIPGDIFEKFYYLLLVVWGVVSALLLFGAAKSYAKVTYKQPTQGVAVELGGAAAFAALVVVGGFVLVRHDKFDLTVRPHGPGEYLITRGSIRAEFGASTRTEEVNAKGEADFKGVPRLFWGTNVRVVPQIEGYKSEPQELVINTEAPDLNLEQPETVVNGRVFPMPVGKHLLTVLAEGESGRPSRVDDYGRFQMLVHKNPADSVRLTVCADGWRVFDDLQPVSHPEIQLRKRDRPCVN